MLLATALKSEKVIGMIAFSPQKIAQLYVDIDYLNLGIGIKLGKRTIYRQIGTLYLPKQ